ncbi:Initiator Replication protein [Acinetobacter stercoris]|uniref:Initiator Replication protein n=1 Tax=Acinetobacter stercoris TaxID=2126983 RepID=A0A2U3N347_9GAMM|nr:Initiator Replication protein [Acinetobacter stercoris]
MDTFKRRVLDAAMSQINESTDIRVTYDQYKQGKTIAGFAFKLKQKEKLKKIEEINRDQNTIDMFYEMTDAQIHTFGNQLSKLHELSHLAVVGESYEDLASRIKQMLKAPEQQKQLHPYLSQLGFSKKVKNYEK